MTSPHILFTRPLALRFAGQPVLQVVGQLEGYTAGQAYEGRLQIINNIGDCTVEWVSGAMPPGTTVRVDNATHEVVIEWPDYQLPDPNNTPVPNGSFEDGDTKWEKGAGWLIGSSASGDFDTYDGTWSAAYTGRGISSMTGVKVPVVVGTEITASIQVQQGASSKSNVSAVVLLCWYDANGNLFHFDPGNIVSSGSNGEWHISRVTAKAPAGAFYVAIAANANRRRQNRRLWVDQARWNHSYPSGANGDDDFCLVLLVRDSAGRDASWTGCVGESAIYVTSRPYGVVMEPEGILSEPPIPLSGSMFRGLYEELESLSSAVPEFLGGQLRAPLVEVVILESMAAPAPTMLSGTLNMPIKNGSGMESIITPSPQMLNVDLKTLLITNSTMEGMTATAPQFMSGTLS